MLWMAYLGLLFFMMGVVALHMIHNVCESTKENGQSQSYKLWGGFVGIGMGTVLMVAGVALWYVKNRPGGRSKNMQINNRGNSRGNNSAARAMPAAMQPIQVGYPVGSRNSSAMMKGSDS